MNYKSSRRPNQFRSPTKTQRASAYTCGTSLKIFASFSTLGRRSAKISGCMYSSKKFSVGQCWVSVRIVTLTRQKARHYYYHSLGVSVVSVESQNFFIRSGKFWANFQRLTLTKLTQNLNPLCGVSFDGLVLGLVLVSVTPTLTYGVMARNRDTVWLRDFFDWRLT